jgi:hypothetical protein
MILLKKLGRQYQPMREHVSRPQLPNRIEVSMQHYAAERIAAAARQVSISYADPRPLQPVQQAALPAPLHIPTNQPPERVPLVPSQLNRQLHFNGMGGELPYAYSRPVVQHDLIPSGGAAAEGKAGKAFRLLLILAIFAVVFYGWWHGLDWLRSHSSPANLSLVTGRVAMAALDRIKRGVGLAAAWVRGTAGY